MNHDCLIESRGDFFAESKIRILYQKTYKMFEKKYDIHICSADEVEELVEFIDTYWQKNHIFTKSRELLNWQHFDKINKQYNFVIAKDKSNGQIHGIIGFIISSLYDHNITKPIRWGAIWKVRDDIPAHGLGIALKGYMELYAPASFAGGVGLSEYSKKIDEKLGEKMGELKQYYILNEKIKDYKLIKKIDNNESMFSRPVDKMQIKEDTMKRIMEEGREYFSQCMPYKSIEYYIERYANHPIYQYHFSELLDINLKAQAMIVWRKASHKESSCIMIVDFIGNRTALIGHYKSFQNLLVKENSEYIIFPCDGIDENIMIEAGFLVRDIASIVLPVYYEPFEQKNVSLCYHFYQTGECGYEDVEYIFVKGDSDQDRPNRLPEEL